MRILRRFKENVLYYVRHRFLELRQRGKNRMRDCNIVMSKSLTFALKTVGLFKMLCEQKKEFVMSRQILRCGTSIGANVKEAQCAQTKKDFVAKMYVAFKESSETEYWLELLHQSDFISQAVFQELWLMNREIYSILSSITKTAKEE